MPQQPSFRSIDEALEDVENLIREFEKKYGCSTDVMREQLSRRIIEGPEFTQWNTLAKLRDDVTTKQTEQLKRT
jgi:hypothetical protein